MATIFRPSEVGTALWSHACIVNLDPPPHHHPARLTPLCHVTVGRSAFTLTKRTCFAGFSAKNFVCRVEHGLVERKGYLYACGGATTQNRPLKHCEKYNLTTNRWVRVQIC